MPSKTADHPAAPAAHERSHDILDNYFLEDDFEDPFASPPPAGDSSNAGKRKQPEGLGIDEEVSVQKRARVPRVKLDETRLLSENGIPALRKRARNLRFKGKGHEFSDAARLLSFYQLWLDGLFPKAKFMDALAMVEKAGHKSSMHKARMDWINEGKPRPADDQEPGTPDAARSSTARSKSPRDQAGAPLPNQADAAISGRLGTDGTPHLPPPARTLSGQEDGDEPDIEDLDALLAEAQSHSPPVRSLAKASKPATSSIFGPGKPRTPAVSEAAGTDDADLDALIAEAEAGEAAGRPAGSPTAPTTEGGRVGGRPVPLAAVAGNEQDDLDDLDALMAEAGTHSTSGSPPPAGTAGGEAKVASANPFADDEEAMAEMEGLW